MEREGRERGKWCGRVCSDVSTGDSSIFLSKSDCLNIDKTRFSDTKQFENIAQGLSIISVFSTYKVYSLPTILVRLFLDYFPSQMSGLYIYTQSTEQLDNKRLSS